MDQAVGNWLEVEPTADVQVAVMNEVVQAYTERLAGSDGEPEDLVVLSEALTARGGAEYELRRYSDAASTGAESTRVAAEAVEKLGDTAETRELLEDALTLALGAALKDDGLDFSEFGALPDLLDLLARLPDPDEGLLVGGVSLGLAAMESCLDRGKYTDALHLAEQHGELSRLLSNCAPLDPYRKVMWARTIRSRAGMEEILGLSDAAAESWENAFRVACAAADLPDADSAGLGAFYARGLPQIAEKHAQHLEDKGDAEGAEEVRRTAQELRTRLGEAEDSPDI